MKNMTSEIYGKIETLHRKVLYMTPSNCNKRLRASFVMIGSGRLVLAHRSISKSPRGWHRW